MLSASKLRIAGKSLREEAHDDGSTTYVFPIVAPVTLQATFRHLQLVDGAVDSRIDFSLAGLRQVSVFQEEQNQRGGQ